MLISVMSRSWRWFETRFMPEKNQRKPGAGIELVGPPPKEGMLGAAKVLMLGRGSAVKR